MNPHARQTCPSHAHLQHLISRADSRLSAATGSNGRLGYRPCCSHFTKEVLGLGCRFLGHQRLPVVTHPKPVHLGTPQPDVSFPPNPKTFRVPHSYLRKPTPPQTPINQRRTDHVKPAPSSETYKTAALVCGP